MCHLSMKFSNMFDHNPPYTSEKIRETHSDKKRPHSLTLRTKVKVIAKSKANALGNKKHASQNKFEQGFAQLLVSN